jgi:hypothetical protein
MLVLELGQIEDVFVDDNIEIAGLVVGGHIGCRECFGHGECITNLPEDRRSILNSLDKTQVKEQREKTKRVCLRMETNLDGHETGRCNLVKLRHETMMILTCALRMTAFTCHR